MSQSHKNILGILAGNIVEYYCLMLWGYLAFYLTPIFFETQDTFSSVLVASTTFGLGFVMRPFGAIFFGYIADKYGRIETLNASITLMIIPTVGIGLTPSYDEIGVFASVLICLFRLLQGFLCGGEAPVSAVLMDEHSPKNSRGFRGGLLCASSLLGALLGLLVSSVCLSESMPQWVWRVPFVSAFVLGGLGHYLRKNITESIVFEQSRVVKNPAAFQQGFLTHLSGIGVVANSLIPFYISTLYINQIFHGGLGLSVLETLGANIINLGLWILLLPIAGLISDKVERHKIMLASAVTLIGLGALAAFIEMNDVNTLIIVQFFILLTGVLYVAPFNAYMMEVFSLHQKCLKFSVYTGLASIFFGAGTPLVLNFVLQYFSNAMQVYLCLSGLVGATSILYHQYFSKNIQV